MAGSAVARAAGEWERAERLGIGRGWLWDHLVLGGRPVSHDAYAVLAAAAATTTTIGVGTMVTAPNFRHPVTTAKAALALDDVSGGATRVAVLWPRGDDAERRFAVLEKAELTA
ncbi:LLM class flavin-dependent oxidoreductase [Actinoplanes sp. NPDC048988]|uniref:LLM class flavin-dependent oxidoreductase n=1 Tax=Actinoplanes sp. NPDC048988 TaxID=3363901 RepID=UPI00371E7914